MKAFWACIVKDVKLFRSAAGIAALCLPVVLMLAMLLFMGETVQGRAYVEPFAIAIRDEDESTFSRVLIRQIEDIELFSEIIDADGESDEELFENGAAAVITMPKDYFYRVYRMEEVPVGIVLNGDMPLESRLVRSVFTSVVDILAANQQSALAAAQVTGADAGSDALYAETAENILNDAISRQGVFDAADQVQENENYIRLSFFVCALSLLALFLPLCVVKTLPEELDMGILQRYRAAGGSGTAFVLSKLAAALFLYAVSAGVLFAIARPPGGAMTAMVAALMFFAGFGLFLLLSVLVKEPGRCQLCGNLIILVMLVVGGALYPLELMPESVQFIAPISVPYYASAGLRAAAGGAAFADVLSVVWPLAAAAVILPLPPLLWLKGRAR